MRRTGCLLIVLAVLILSGPAPVRTAAAAQQTPVSSDPLVSSEKGETKSVDSAVQEMNRILGEREANKHLVPPVSGWTIGLLIAYCSLIVTVSVLGGWLPSWVELTHTRMQTVISFVGGLMLGIGVFHLLPHSTHSLPTIDSSARWMMVGVVTMFLLIRTFHFHHHGPLEISPDAEAGHSGSHRHNHRHSQSHVSAHDHDHDHSDKGQVPARRAAGGTGLLNVISDAVEADTGPAHDHSTPAISGGPACGHAHQLSWIGIAAGLSLHTLIDGIALAASVQAESLHRTYLSLFGLGTFLAVMLHKPLDAVSITSLMAASGWPQKSRNYVNAAFAMMCPAGALLFLLGIRGLGGFQQYFVGAALAFSAGVFVCISLSDLLPEMEFHAHNRVRLTLVLAAGIILAWAITLLEPANLH